MAETQGASDCHHIPGKSAEKGCFQYQEGTWKNYSEQILGYVAPRTYINERYVAVMMVQKWLKKGYTAYQIGLIWNGGEPVEKKGINSHGQEYDSGRYARNLLTYL